MSSTGPDLRPTARRGSDGGGRRRALAALQAAGEDSAAVVVVGLDALGEEPWAVLHAAGIGVARARTVGEALTALAEQEMHVVVADVRQGRRLVRAVRRDAQLATVHVILCAALDSPRELRAALEASADDVMRVPLEPEVLAARVAGGLRAAGLRASEAMLRSLVANIPGAVYRCACDADWTMEYLSDEIEQISGHPASDFIASECAASRA